MAIGIRDITDWIQDNWKLIGGIGAAVFLWRRRDKIMDRFTPNDDGTSGTGGQIGGPIPKRD